jgi:hypothetical protein
MKSHAVKMLSRNEATGKWQIVTAPVAARISVDLKITKPTVDLATKKRFGIDGFPY